MIIEYLFSIENCDMEQFKVDTNRPHMIRKLQTDDPEWIGLEYFQCANCPVSRGNNFVCPVASDLNQVINRFSVLLSFQVAEVRVVDDNRIYYKHCTVQEGLKSLMGLIMATSACPLLRPLRAMAQFHLPFATYEESLTRIVGSYMIGQYLKMQDAERPDFMLKGLSERYTGLQQLNMAFAERIRMIAQTDASKNAIIHLFALSNLVDQSIKDGLPELKVFYSMSH
jgi:hypothetical protein